MNGIHDGNRHTDLPTYMKSIGSCSLKYDKRIKKVDKEPEQTCDPNSRSVLDPSSVHEVSRRKSVDGDDLRNMRKENYVNSIIAEKSKYSFSGLY